MTAARSRRFRLDPATVRDSLAAILFCGTTLVCAGVLPAGCYVDSGDYGRFADRRIGLYDGQWCYSTRTVPGATPPLLEGVVGPILPVVRHRPMKSNLAGYTIVTVPLWPLLLVTGWPAVAAAVRHWKD